MAISGFAWVNIHIKHSPSGLPLKKLEPLETDLITLLAMHFKAWAHINGNVNNLLQLPGERHCRGIDGQGRKRVPCVGNRERRR